MFVTAQTDQTCFVLIITYRAQRAVIASFCPWRRIRVIESRTRFFSRVSAATRRSCWKTSPTSATPSQRAWWFSAGETTTTTTRTGGSCGRRASTASSTTGRPVHGLVVSRSAYLIIPQRVSWWPDCRPGEVMSRHSLTEPRRDDLKSFPLPRFSENQYTRQICIHCAVEALVYVTSWSLNECCCV